MMMITINKDWLTIAFVFGISLGVLLGYALKTFLG